MKGMKGEKFGKSGGGKHAPKTSKLLHTTSNVEALGKSRKGR